ncbi:MAG: AbrB family transcriptional regulator [Burkholderiales bacterium]|nr:AbrB family transcriptional regulator [Burkholderiales bacterium]
MRFSSPVRIAATLLLALAAALLCVWLRTPLPWMIGPLLATGAASVLRAPTRSSAPLRNMGQCTIGLALGLYFTPQVGAMVLSLWWAVLLGVVWAMVLGWLFDLWLQRVNAHRLPGLDRATTWFAGAIGAASEMTLLAERAGGRTDLVAAAHSMRLLIVAVLIPFALQFSGQHGLDASFNSISARFDVGGLLWLALAASGASLLLDRMGRANPWFMGPMLVAMGLTLAGIEFSAIPSWLSSAAQLLIGVSLGVRFTPAFVHTAPRWLATVALGTLVLIVLSAAFAWLLSLGTGLHPATMVLGTAPGGIAEMSITAKVLQLGAPVVTVFQICRLFAVLVLVDPLFHWQQRRL